MNKKDKRDISIFILIGIFLLLFFTIPMLRYILGFIVVLFAVIYMTRRYRHMIKRETAEPYYVNSKCPICGHEWNRVKYLKGDIPKGAIVVCDHCGNKYRHVHKY